MKSPTRYTIRLLIMSVVMGLSILLLPHLVQATSAQEQLVTCADITEISAQECAVLQELYDAGMGRNSPQWFIDDSPCDWGYIFSAEIISDWVGCNNKGEIISLRHEGGSVRMSNYPASIVAKLPGLRSLVIYSFYGRDDTLSSEVELITQLESLRFIGVSGIPIEIGRLHNLISLSFEETFVTSLPNEIGSLTKLRSLWITNNSKLTHIPKEIANLDQLNHLEISGNRLLESVPYELRQENLPNVNSYDVNVPADDAPSQQPTNPSGNSGGECVIPASGPWPPCATGGQTAPPATDNSDCLIPSSGPWPPCATGGQTAPPATDSNDCAIPPSGPWPPCATGGQAVPPVIDSSDCVIPPSGPWPPCATNVVESNLISDWTSEYFDNPTFAGQPAFTATQTEINVDWGYAAPAVGFSAENFSVRWTRTYDIKTASIYNFNTQTTDRVRILYDGKPIISNNGKLNVQRPGTRRTSDHQLLMRPGVHTITIELLDWVSASPTPHERYAALTVSSHVVRTNFNLSGVQHTLQVERQVTTQSSVKARIDFSASNLPDPFVAVVVYPRTSDGEFIYSQSGVYDVPVLSADYEQMYFNLMAQLPGGRTIIDTVTLENQ